MHLDLPGRSLVSQAFLPTRETGPSKPSGFLMNFLREKHGVVRDEIFVNGYYPVALLLAPSRIIGVSGRTVSYGGDTRPKSEPNRPCPQIRSSIIRTLLEGFTWAALGDARPKRLKLRAPFRQEKPAWEILLYLLPLKQLTIIHRPLDDIGRGVTGLHSRLEDHAPSLRHRHLFGGADARHR